MLGSESHILDSKIGIPLISQFFIENGFFFNLSVTISFSYDENKDWINFSKHLKFSRFFPYLLSLPSLLLSLLPFLLPLLFILFLATPHDLWDLSSPTRGWTPGWKQWKRRLTTVDTWGDSTFFSFYWSVNQRQETHLKKKSDSSLFLLM